MFGVARILGHEPLQKIDVALKAPRSLVQAGGFRAVLYSRYILRTPGIDSNDDQAQAEHRDSHHALLSILIFESVCLGRHFLKPAVFAVGFQRIGARAQKTMGIVRTPGGVPSGPIRVWASTDPAYFMASSQADVFLIASSPAAVMHRRPICALGSGLGDRHAIAS